MRDPLDITPDEIAALLPGARVIEIPTAWFDRLKPSPNVFEQFYHYLISLDCEMDRDLHNRARVGHKLQRRLVEAEKNRLKARGLKGDKLERALSWNDMGSGPQEMFAERRVVGDAVCVLPPYSAEEDEVHSRLLREQIEVRQRQSKKSRAKVSGSSFYYWLIAAREHDDRIGDLARDISEDEKFPRNATTFKEVTTYLERLGASTPAIESAEEAWLEYADRYPNRVQVSVFCDLCDGRIEPGAGAVVFRSCYEILHDKCDQERVENEDRVLVADLYKDGLRVFLQFAEAHEGFWSADTERKLRLWGVRDRAPVKEQVYFVQIGYSGPIKIGYTATSVAQRVASLQTGCPEKLRLLAALDGGREVEADLHARFTKHRKNGEWFEPHPDLIAFITTIAMPQQ